MDKIFRGIGMTFVAFFFAQLFNFMLGLGVAHGQWQRIPALGFWATYLMVVGLTALAGALGLRTYKS